MINSISKNIFAHFHFFFVCSKLRHPNCLLFMGACTQPGKFMIVTELAVASVDKLIKVCAHAPQRHPFAPFLAQFCSLLLFSLSCLCSLFSLSLSPSPLLPRFLTGAWFVYFVSSTNAIRKRRSAWHELAALQEAISRTASRSKSFKLLGKPVNNNDNNNNNETTTATIFTTATTTQPINSVIKIFLFCAVQVDKNNNVKISDFGLSQLKACATSGGAVGTPLYVT